MYNNNRKLKEVLIMKDVEYIYNYFKELSPICLPNTTYIVKYNTILHEAKKAKLIEIKENCLAKWLPKNGRDIDFYDDNIITFSSFYAFGYLTYTYHNYDHVDDLILSGFEQGDFDNYKIYDKQSNSSNASSAGDMREQCTWETFSTPQPF